MARATGSQSTEARIIHHPRRAVPGNHQQFINMADRITEGGDR